MNRLIKFDCLDNIEWMKFDVDNINIHSEFESIRFINSLNISHFCGIYKIIYLTIIKVHNFSIEIDD